LDSLFQNINKIKCGMTVLQLTRKCQKTRLAPFFLNFNLITR